MQQKRGGLQKKRRAKNECSKKEEAYKKKTVKKGSKRTECSKNRDIKISDRQNYTVPTRKNKS